MIIIRLPYIFMAYFIALPFMLSLDNYFHTFLNCMVLSMMFSLVLGAIIIRDRRERLKEEIAIEEENKRAYDLMVQTHAAVQRHNIMKLCKIDKVCPVCATSADECAECINYRLFVPDRNKVCEACSRCEGNGECI